jgi:hypothetical protein
VEKLREDAADRGLRPPSTAEYLDAIRALIEVPEFARDEVWSQVEEILLLKPPSAAINF